MTAYKNHDFDPILMTGGDSLIFRAFEVTGGCGDLNQCPDKFCESPLKNNVTVSQGNFLNLIAFEIRYMNNFLVNNNSEY